MKSVNNFLCQILKQCQMMLFSNRGMDVVYGSDESYGNILQQAFTVVCGHCFFKVVCAPTPTSNFVFEKRQARLQPSKFISEGWGSFIISSIKITPYPAKIHSSAVVILYLHWLVIICFYHFMFSLGLNNDFNKLISQLIIELST